MNISERFQPIRVWGGCFDGRNRVIVSGKSKKAAIEALNRYVRVSASQFNEYADETGNEAEVSPC